jgi:hypothetical protein
MNGENCVVRTLTVCTEREILFRWSNKGGEWWGGGGGGGGKKT